MKLISYSRVSTEEQSLEGRSLDAQDETMRVYASANNALITHQIRDEGFSGGTLDRPGLQRALELLDQADGLIIAKLDRLSRDVLQCLTMIDNHFRKKKLIILDLQVDTSTPAGKLQLQLLLAFAEMERSLIRARTSDALQFRKSKGQRHTRIAPYGYKWEGGYAVKDHSEQHWLLRMRALAKETRPDGLARYSFSEIAALLKEEGALNRKGKALSRQGIRNIVMEHDGEEMRKIRSRGPRKAASPA